MMTDPIADLLARIRNAALARHDVTRVPASKIKKAIAEIMKQEGYREEELITADQVRVYIAEEAKVMLEGGKRRTKCQTFTQADISPELGIEARSFDTTIDDMNRIQEAIVWGENE